MNKMSPGLLQQPRLGRFIREAFSRHKYWALSTILLRCAAMSGKVLWPIYVKLMTDELVLAYGTHVINWERLFWINVLGFVAWFIEEVALTASQVVSSRRTGQMRADIRLFVLADLYRQSQQFFHDRFAGSISTSLRDLSESVSDVFNEITDLLIPTFVLFLILGTIFLKLHVGYILVMLIWMVFQIALIVMTRNKMQDRSGRYADKRSELFGKLIDSMSNNMAVASFATQEQEHRHITQAEDEVVTHRTGVVRYSNLVHLGSAFLEVTAVFFGFILVYFYLFAQGQATVGDFMFMIMGIYGLMSAVRTISNRTFWLYEQIGIGQEAIRKIVVPHAIQDDADAPALQVTKAEIVLEDVGFAYFPDKPVLQDVTITIRSGEKIGLVGYSGAGKTTLTSLLLRFYELTTGRILIDGQDISKVTQHSLRRAIALIPQDTSLFHRSLRDNIRVANIDASDEDILKASKLAGAHDFIMKLPLQYDTLVGERGIKLSGGQRQRIAIARAFLKDAPILMLDEATSALDSVTEREIQNALDQVMKGRTTFVIAHRLSTLSRMDRILVFDKGSVIEQGSHEALLAMDGHYARMWAMQAGGFMPENEEPETTI